MATTLAKNMRKRFDRIKTFTTSSLGTLKKLAKSTKKMLTQDRKKLLIIEIYGTNL